MSNQKILEKITHYQKLGVGFSDDILNTALYDKDIWSIIAVNGEINSYKLNLQQAVDMLKAAHEEDGYDYDELLIEAVYKTKTYVIESEALYKYATLKLITEIEASSETEALEQFKTEGTTVKTQFLDGVLKEESDGRVIEVKDVED